MAYEKVKGIILVITCKKYLPTRYRNFKIDEAAVESLGWKILYVIGDYSMKHKKLQREQHVFCEEYDATTGRHILKIECEDTYFHLFKKLALAMKIVDSLYEIEEGLLRLGDDVIINDTHLCEFLQMPNKADYMGCNKNKQNYFVDDLNILRNTVDDTFMMNYYKTRSSELQTPEFGSIGGDGLAEYTRRPKIDVYAGGVVVYYSRRAYNAIIESATKINYDVLHYDGFTCSYPYVIEDVAVAFILYMNKIPLTYYPTYIDVEGGGGDIIVADDDDMQHKYIGVHTNEHR